MEGATSLLNGTLLPQGAILYQAVIPTYDKQHRMDAILHSKKLTVVDQNQIHADEVRIDFFDDEQVLNGRVITPEATYLQKKDTSGKPISFVQTDKPVRMISDHLWATGTGLFFSLVPQHEQGFIYGPVRALIHMDSPHKAMSSASSNPIRRAGIALAAATSIASAQPAPNSDEALKNRQLTPEQISAAHDLAKSKAAGLPIAQADTENQAKATLSKAAETDKKVASFLKDNGLKTEMGEEDDFNSSVPPPPVQASPDLTEITCDSGLYSDAAENVLVFVKNVKVHSPQFNLEGANEIKAYMAEKPASTKKEDTDKAKQEKPKNGDQQLSSRMGTIKKIVATGVLKINRPDDGVQGPMSASGRILIYDDEKKEITLMGGDPWIISNKGSGTVIGKGGYIRYNTETGEVTTGGGRLQAFGKIEQPKK
jgi:hypothetical protein